MEVMNNKLRSPKRQDSQFSQSSVSSRPSSLAPSPKLGLSDLDQDQNTSRKVLLNRQSISPMAPRFRTAHMRRDNSLSSQSEFGVLSSRASDSSPKELSVSLVDEDSKSGRGSTPGSPSTLPSPPPPRTPVTNINQTQSSVRVKNPERQRGSVILSESSISAIEPPPEVKKPLRKIPPKLVTLEDTSDSSVPTVSSLSRATSRIRTKRFGSASIRAPLARPRDDSMPSPMQASPISIPSPGSLAAPDMDSEAEIASTPKAIHFPSTSPTGEGLSRSPRRRKISMEERERRRKLSGESGVGRVRRVSGSRRVPEDHRRNSATGHDGDDEGYDELLSAYESEEGSRDGHARSVEA